MAILYIYMNIASIYCDSIQYSHRIKGNPLKSLIYRFYKLKNLEPVSEQSAICSDIHCRYWDKVFFVNHSLKFLQSSRWSLSLGNLLCKWRFFIFYIYVSSIPNSQIIYSRWIITWQMWNKFSMLFLHSFSIKFVSFIRPNITCGSVTIELDQLTISCWTS